MERSNVGRERANVSYVTTQTASPDLKTMVVGYANGTVRVIDIPTGTELFQFNVQGVITSAEVSLDGTTILIQTRDGRVHAFDARTGKRLQ